MHEIYDSIQGESTLAGTPCTFIRLAGCPLRCGYCDTTQAIPTDSGEWMAMEAIIAEVKRQGRPLVLVTGGEPLAQKQCIELLKELGKLDCIVQLETSGAYLIDQVPESVHRIVDIKTPGSLEVERNRLENLALLTANDELKFVITSRDDYEWVRQFIVEYNLAACEATLLMSPAYGSVAGSDLCAWMLEDRLPARMQLQLHKVIWGAQATGV
ncbi:radical SAM protein [Mariprofundus micogutta]|nr:radical SAM protein [Mariprofundus micogutta]